MSSVYIYTVLIDPQRHAEEKKNAKKIYFYGARSHVNRNTIKLFLQKN